MGEPFVVPRDPAVSLVPPGHAWRGVRIYRVDRKTPVSDEVRSCADMIAQQVEHLRCSGQATPFNGRLVNVVSWTTESDTIVLHTEWTDYFTYLAASFHHRDDPRANPICPLAVAVAPFGERGACFLQRRSGVTEIAGNVHIFGGSLGQGDDPDVAAMAIAERKLGVTLSRVAFVLTGMVHEAVQHVLTITYAVEIKAREVEYVRARLGAALIELPAFDEGVIEAFLECHPITEWNPDGYYGFLAGLLHVNLRSADEIGVIAQRTSERLRTHPYRYTYPAERYLAPIGA